jgi:hypothetical protein
MTEMLGGPAGSADGRTKPDAMLTGGKSLNLSRAVMGELIRKRSPFACASSLACYPYSHQVVLAPYQQSTGQSETF